MTTEAKIRAFQIHHIFPVELYKNLAIVTELKNLLATGPADIA